MRIYRPATPDIGLLLAIMALFLIGLAAIYSASHVVSGDGKLIRQAIWGIVGSVGLLVLARCDYRMWAGYSRALLFITLLALLATFFTRPINGARSWIDLHFFLLQPSEFAKLMLIVSFASLLSRYGDRLRTLPFFLRSLLFCAIPILMVLAQPDFGTAMILCAIWFAMVFTAGARWWMLGALCVGALLLFSVAWQFDLIKEYQKKRLDFIHADPAGTGYHQRQARIAIGSGELFGKGYLHGKQAQGGFLPEQDTDFIFAVIGEEFGFLGCLVILGLYMFVLFRLLRIAEEADTPYGRLITIGVAAMLATHTFINIGMCLSLSPVTGVPLPFISYGGSNLLTNLLSIGLVLNISRHRQTRRTWAAQEEELVRL
ncbi:MAG: rod shape-determining protein RodA [Armatimonadota bacterium]